METVSSVLVTVQGPDERVELQLPAHQPIVELLPLLVEVCCGGQVIEGTEWELGLLGGLAFDGARTLHDVGVMDGSRLHLRDAGAPVLNYLTDEPSGGPADPAEVDMMLASGWEESLLPQERTRLVLPPTGSGPNRPGPAPHGGVARGGRAARRPAAQTP